MSWTTPDGSAPLRPTHVLAHLSDSHLTSAGVRYNLYRMAGLASGAFDYAVQMDAQGGFTLRVTVDGQTSALSGDTQSDFYYYNVVSGTLDLLNRPFVQAEGQNAAA